MTTTRRTSRSGRLVAALAVTFASLVALVSVGLAAGVSPINLSLSVTELSHEQAELVAQEVRAAVRPPAAAGLRPVVQLRHLPAAVAAPAAPPAALPQPSAAAAPAPLAAPERLLKAPAATKPEVVAAQPERPLPPVTPEAVAPQKPVRGDLTGPLLDDARRLLQKTQPDDRQGGDRHQRPGVTKADGDRPIAKPPTKGGPPDSKHPHGDRGGPGDGRPGGPGGDRAPGGQGPGPGPGGPGPGQPPPNRPH